MYPREAVDDALLLFAGGVSRVEISRRLGIPAATVRHWIRGSRRSRPAETACFRCAGTAIPESYAYMLGMYLGDGHIVVGRRGVQSLSVFGDDMWPGVLDEVEAGMADLMRGAVCRVRRQGCTQVKSYSKHWTCLFPQHGPGMKHTRSIRLEEWQQQIVDARPELFLKGLFHSDGCRTTNRVRSRRPDGPVREYAYPRWFFYNTSDDIMRMAEAALDQLCIAHRRARPNVLSVARRDAVAALDRAIGPKT
ncbi:helix-turn-helix domain-containing protein [Pseudonocardia sp. C8]|uniref:helix-turn-helix domain-containing protein n=1 Tax=Pseudonocardia sp. C8 TaxID=2762759 RepID=UPI0016431A7B|nr:helix-turn-helix domain-containing protein [Pseudonocardia sp. C8]MBC3191564.1 helix-turn-helix domain-containing protein [Pseudonocardia sp. C8]